MGGVFVCPSEKKRELKTKSEYEKEEGDEWRGKGKMEESMM